MKKAIRDSFWKLAAAESAFVGSEFLAPVVRGHGVAVKIAGVRCLLTINPREFQGFGIFLANSHLDATFVRDASAIERRDYLRLFPAVRLIAGAMQRGNVLATPENLADDRFAIAGAVVVNLCDRVELFDVMLARFDGTQFWFDALDPRADLAMAAHLRRSIVEMADPNDLERAGMSKGQRLAYALEYTRRATKILADRRGRDDERLRLALAHAGAVLCDFTDAQDAYRVTYSVDGRRHTSIVGKNNLTVNSAGICLSGQDQNFDLSSLVGVLRELESHG
jgi:hypothetical protein